MSKVNSKNCYVRIKNKTIQYLNFKGNRLPIVYLIFKENCKLKRPFNHTLFKGLAIKVTPRKWLCKNLLYFSKCCYVKTVTDLDYKTGTTIEKGLDCNRVWLNYKKNVRFKSALGTLNYCKNFENQTGRKLYLIYFKNEVLLKNSVTLQF